MGTVTEVSLVWNKLQTGVLSKRPLVLVGNEWKEVVDAWSKNLIVSDSDLGLLDFAANADEASEIIISKAIGVDECPKCTAPCQPDARFAARGFTLPAAPANRTPAARKCSPQQAQHQYHTGCLAHSTRTRERDASIHGRFSMRAFALA